MKKLLISAGHCGPKESGSVKFLNEKNENIRLVNDIREKIYRKLSFDQMQCVMTMTNQKLTDRIKMVNLFCGDDGIAIEFHFNKLNGKASGTECFVANYASSKSEVMAEELSELISRTLSIYNGGMRRERQSYLGKLGFVSKTNCPAVIVEVCYLDVVLDVSKYRENYYALVDAISDYLINKMK